MGTRRQNHSCDQCRKSKRACDAPSFNRDRSAAGPPHGPGITNIVAPEPCSYCLKTRKTCTLDWAIRLHRQTHSRFSRVQPKNAPKDSNARSNDTKNGAETASRGAVHLPHDGFVLNAPIHQRGIFHDAPVPDAGNFVTWPESNLPDPPAFDHSFSLPPDQHTALVSSLSSDALAEPSADLSRLSQGLSNASNNTTGEDSVSDVYDITWDSRHTSVTGHGARSITSSTRSDRTPPRSDGSGWSGYRRGSNNWSCHSQSLSPYSPNQAIPAQSINHFISTGLLKIYHDVLENNLTCWVTETTCPYKTRDLTVYAPSPSDATNEWGPSWSNRIYARTLQLDKVALTNRMIHLTHSENQAVTRALNLCIAAFASQWAQGSRRQSETYHVGSDFGESPGPTPTEEFDRNIQRQLWEQARESLQRLSDVECFRMAAAEFIFGLTQKPFDSHDQPLEPAIPDVFAGVTGAQGLKSLVMHNLDDLISTEGPPIYMERAARKMQALKSRVDTMRYKSRRSDNKPMLSYEDHATIDLLYWLAVMFDTISSSINDRPVVVNDEESQHHAFPESNRSVVSQLNEGTTIGRWDIELFIQDNIHEPKKIPQWPCSHNEAADSIIRSAPIKVLFFRQVSYLQSMVRNNTRGKPLDDLIHTTTCVYRYWEMTYGRFFRAMVDDINFVPIRIQGWFLCIWAHFLLASLILGDLIEYVDTNKLGTPSGTQSRLAMNTVSTIRNDSVRHLADLARISTPHPEDSSRMAQVDFHHAVNESVILTEPWTIILIKAFSSAATILLGVAEEAITKGSGLGTGGEELVAGLRMEEECIKALWNLGKKSDLSRKTAEVLSMALSRLHASLGTGF
ncbi:GAL4 [Geosmithia morbida]|uniref:GAL4 n=1 Tax=Geosmithia morbida TaxID=1094350 RepID=A0A9P5D207_9HYPO|nr:GAL4 [Geosmithia morbida]KAF4120335.1 GAL4 [Geosmithia morbida]